jgi:hypothetical protein
MFSAFYALVNIFIACFKFYSHGEFLHWFASAGLLFLSALIIYRTVQLRKDVLQTFDLRLKQRDIDAREACVSLAKSLVNNFTFGMYGIGTSLILVSWLFRNRP